MKLIKSVVNNDGGTKLASDWTLSATAGSGPTDRNIAELGSVQTFHTAYANVSYALAETAAPTGYTNGVVWSCTGAVQASDDTHVTVAQGGDVTCTITNTDNTPRLKLIKSVVNNDGGTKLASDWTLSATAGSGPTDRNIAELGSVQTFHDAYANVSYALAETAAPVGYTNGTTWSCSGTGIAASDSTHVTLAQNGSVTCTIINTDNTPQLKLIKSVVNSDGGTKLADRKSVV